MKGSQQQLRQSIGQYLKQNGSKALKAIKSSGVQLSQQEEQSLQSGSLDGFSDQQLHERFNSKVLGILGISLGSQQGQSQSSSQGSPSQAVGQGNQSGRQSGSRGGSGQSE